MRIFHTKSIKRAALIFIAPLLVCALCACAASPIPAAEASKETAAPEETSKPAPEETSKPAPEPTYCPGDHGSLILAVFDDNHARSDFYPYFHNICSSVSCGPDEDGHCYGIEADGAPIYYFYPQHHDKIPVLSAGEDFDALLPTAYSCWYDRIFVWRLGAEDEETPIEFESVDQLKEYAASEAAWDGAEKLLADICVRYGERYWTDGVHVGTDSGVDGYSIIFTP